MTRIFKDPALQCFVARNARWLAEEKYTWQRSAALLEEVYRRAIGSLKR